MVKTAIRIAIVCTCAFGLMSGTGCRSRGRVGGDSLVPEPLGGNIALGERFEDGVRIEGVVFPDVLFGFDSSQILGSEIGKIEKVASYLKQNSGVRLITEGHCDERGSREYNVSLGEYRAHAVRRHLVRLGINASRIQTRSYGEEQPVDFGHNESAWRRNRRVAFAFYR
ncbi:OmpA family protein [Verrucomicrobiota bacterium]